MTFGTMERIQTVTVGSGGAASIEFTNIPTTYDDLVIKVSARSTGGFVGNVVDSVIAYFNTDTSSTTNYTMRTLLGSGASASSDTTKRGGFVSGSGATTSTFGNTEFYIPNYRSNANKSLSVDGVSENNATTAYAGLQAVLWSNTAAITAITLKMESASNFVQHSTASLYGITRVPAGAKATGGVIYDDATYWYHAFTSSGTFTPSQSLSCDVLVVAGGGSGGLSAPGGGGAGGLLAHTNQSLTATNYTITVGGGGAGVTVSGAGTKGSNSQFGSLTASEGGGAGRSTSGGGVPNGGSGGGGAEFGGFSAGGTATASQGFNGGNNNGGGAW